MVGSQKVAVVMPAYNAAATLHQTVSAIDRSVVDDIILVDDSSRDQTADVARDLGLFVFKHDRNLGYGGNQKSCYRLALARQADIVVMVHPDYQYDPRLVPAMAFMIHSGIYDVVLGSRILCNTARAGGMPLVKYVGNRLLTAFQNLVIGEKLSEYRTPDIPPQQNVRFFSICGPDGEAQAQGGARKECLCVVEFLAEGGNGEAAMGGTQWQ